MARTFPTDGVSPCDFYAEGAPDRALGHFQWDLTGSSVPAADGIIFIDVNDATTIASGTMKGLVVDYTGSGTKTGGTIKAMTVEATFSGYVTYAYGLSIETDCGSGAGPAILWGLNISMDEPGSSITGGYFDGINIYMNIGSSTPAESAFLRLGTQGTDTLTWGFDFQGRVTNLYRFKGAGYAPLTAGPAGGNLATDCPGRSLTYRVMVGSTAHYVPMYSD